MGTKAGIRLEPWYRVLGVVTRGVTRILYARQCKQLLYLARLAYHEARKSPRMRYVVEVQCQFCGDPNAPHRIRHPMAYREFLLGAIVATEWLCSHNHHRTAVKGYLIRPGVTGWTKEALLGGSQQSEDQGRPLTRRPIPEKQRRETKSL